jgi:hypothetical protein
MFLFRSTRENPLETNYYYMRIVIDEKADINAFATSLAVDDQGAVNG